MSSRLDRLVSLLETGTSSSIRQTAAKQLAQLATKNLSTDGPYVADDTKHHVADYSSLIPVVSRILPCLRSKNFDTRTAASSALSQICNAIPVWAPPDTSSSNGIKEEDNDGAAPYPAIDLMALMYHTSPLVASTGREFSRATTYSNPNDLRKAKKEAMKRLGIDFLEGMDDDAMDWEAELGNGNGNSTPDSDTATKKEEGGQNDQDLLKTEALREEVVSPTTPKEAEPETPTAGLSARELNRLKRKRKGGGAAVAAVAPPKSTPDSKYSTSMARESSPKVRLLTPQTGDGRSTSAGPSPLGQSDEKVVIDPSKGGQVETAQSNTLSLTKMIEVVDGFWPWEGVIRVLEVDLFDSSWTTRHGAACAIRDILKPQGSCAGMSSKLSSAENTRAHERWCNDLAAKIICVLVLDRFCDFSSDQSVSPVRECAAQTLASLFIHMPKRTLYATHEILLKMARQEFSAEDNGKPYIWQVRHGGMLGLKYEVAVRRDIVVQQAKKEDDAMDVDEGRTTDVTNQNTDFLKSVVSTAILGLSDSDDDVRSVAASTLLPVAADIVKLLPTELPLVLAVLWDGLANMKDDLSSSVRAVMELLGKLVAYPEVISILANSDQSKPLSSLAPTLFAFFRHTIATVRLQVITTLHSFLLVDELPKDWLSSAFLCLLFQNLLVEERISIREATLEIWKTAVRLLSAMENVLPAVVSSPLISDWFALMLQPWGHALDVSLFFQLPTHGSQSVDHGKPQERHNVDKAMLAQDVVLVTSEVIWESRIACAQAIGYLVAVWPNAAEADTVFRNIILYYLNSSSALQRVIAAVVAEECSHEASKAQPEGAERLLSPEFVAALADMLIGVIGQSPLNCYLETLPNLRRLATDCNNLLGKFTASGLIASSDIPQVSFDVDSTGLRNDMFSIDIAKKVAHPIFDDLRPRISRLKKKELASYDALRASLLSHIDSWSASKERYEVRTLATAAATLVALKSVPAKVGNVIKSIMNGIKFEESLVFQKRFASALAGMVDLGLAKLNAVVPVTKVVKNLCAFLCSDPSQTPCFDPTSGLSKGILSFRLATSPALGEKGESTETAEMTTAYISRRGAELALAQLSRRFGSQLFERVPMIWQSTTDGLSLACQGGQLEDVDKRLEKQVGQDVIDSLITIQTVVPAMHSELWPKVVELLPSILLTLRSRFAVVRQTAARCFSTICDVVTAEAMRYTIEEVLPLLGNSKSVTDRQGAIEAVFHIVARLDVKALPYVIFLVVPVLGRMSDPDDDIRSTSTNTFASLIKMVPLEVGLPDPEGFPPAMMERRDKERGFLAQLLDGSKVEHYPLPVKINAELRKYQVEGVSWLAFLAKYQLHGVLCDDMGLGKTLQSICILASKHFERAEKHRTNPGPDTTHLPSLIICPPTLTGHWYYEILKYAESLKPIMYTGAARDRSRLVSKLQKHDVVITSYEVVRNDIQALSGFEWLYCILDEGHVIKNPKTKLTKAVKTLRAQHRVILSGTPIQNNVLELWSLFDFLMPGFLGTERSFNERYGKPILANRDSKSPAKTGEAAALALEALHKQVLPFLLRRLKEDVLDDLPPKIIQDYYCELSDLQKQLYDDFSDSAAGAQVQSAVAANGTGKTQQHVFQSLQYLKKLCNHPALVLKEDDPATKVILQKFRKHKDDASPLRDLTHAPKLQALRQLLNDCGIGLASPDSANEDRKGLSNDTALESNSFSQHRVLIFCQMKRMIDIIESDLFKALMPSVTYMRLDGGTDTNKRHAIVQTFNADPSIDCLLLTTHVGGLGLTLTGADTVIFVEHDWNPMKDLQAMDRAHRIGQKKVVNVYRLITKDTLEDKIMGLQRFKLNIANSVITQQNSGLSSMSTDLVLDLFKRSPEDEAKKKKSAEGGGGSKHILAGLEDLPAEGEYDNLDLSSFLRNQ